LLALAVARFGVVERMALALNYKVNNEG
jgi:hypothetical protein